jgi:hypothetical protein
MSRYEISEREATELGLYGGRPPDGERYDVLPVPEREETVEERAEREAAEQEHLARMADEGFAAARPSRRELEARGNR